MKIKHFILATSTVVAALFFTGAYWSLDRVIDGIVRANANRISEAATRITFSAMYQLMSSGWSRKQADAFLRIPEGDGASVDAHGEPAPFFHIARKHVGQSHAPIALADAVAFLVPELEHRRPGFKNDKVVFYRTVYSA